MITPQRNSSNIILRDINMSPQERLNGKYVDTTDLLELRKKYKDKKIVFTAGSWDLLHVGQMRYLEKAKQQGDLLVVGVNSNESIRKVKGKNKPIMDEMIRSEGLTYMRAVDYVTIIPTPSCQPVLGLLKPDIFVTVGEEWNDEFKKSKEYKTVKEYGGEVKLVERQSPYISTTKIIERVVGAHMGDVFKEFMKMRKKPLKEK
ncbi:MAG: adenylyltransferase/cytidyltransferase family protein [Candidatus Dojkabacteria bacterium]|nr:adenylyltransferase/cytidyltransferase family protein [Candidatus Dojkabacteria bacterium]